MKADYKHNQFCNVVEKEENVYEDSVSLGNIIQDSNLPKENGNQGAVVSKPTVKPPSYETNAFKERVPSQKAPAPPPPASSESKPITPIHSTVIQVGSPHHAGGKNTFEHLSHSTPENCDLTAHPNDPCAPTSATNPSGVPTSAVPPNTMGKSQSLQLNQTKTAETESYAQKRKSFTLPQDLVTRL